MSCLSTAQTRMSLPNVQSFASTPVKRVLGERRAGDPPQLVASNRRLVERLGWVPRFADTATIIRSALEWERRLVS